MEISVLNIAFISKFPKCVCVCERAHVRVRRCTFTSCVSIWWMSLRHSKPASCVMTACEKLHACARVCV